MRLLSILAMYFYPNFVVVSFFYAGHHRCYLLSTGTIKTRAFHSFITFSRLYNEIPHQPQIEINLDVANVRLYYKVFKSQILEVSSKFDFTVFAR